MQKIIRYCKFQHLIVIPVVDWIAVVMDEVSSVVGETFEIIVEGVKVVEVVELSDNKRVIVEEWFFVSAASNERVISLVFVVDAFIDSNASAVEVVIVVDEVTVAVLTVEKVADLEVKFVVGTTSGGGGQYVLYGHSPISDVKHA